MFILFLSKFFILKTVAIFGSGNGSNAENIYNYFLNSSDVKIVFFCTNNKNAFIVNRAEKLNVPILFTNKDHLAKNSGIQKELKNYNVDYIILAGFLLKIPNNIISLYPKKIINIHPSLLPKYGGKGMYGLNVHAAVLKNKELESGITIHFVNEYYDEGEIILQKKCFISKEETINSLDKKIRFLELSFFPKTIEKIIFS